MIPIISFLIWGLIAIAIHEIGHVYWAKKEGIYKGLSFTFLSVHTKLKEPYKSKIGYAMGFIFSLASLPIFYYLVDERLIIGFIGLIGLSLFDFIIICVPKKYYVKEEVGVSK